MQQISLPEILTAESFLHIIACRSSGSQAANTEQSNPHPYFDSRLHTDRTRECTPPGLGPSGQEGWTDPSPAGGSMSCQPFDVRAGAAASFRFWRNKKMTDSLKSAIAFPADLLCLWFCSFLSCFSFLLCLSGTNSQNGHPCRKHWSSDNRCHEQRIHFKSFCQNR